MIHDPLNQRKTTSACLGPVDPERLREEFEQRGYVEDTPNGVARMIFRNESDRLWLIRDPATGTLSVTSERDRPLPGWLPIPSPDDVRALLSSADPRDRLAGLQMAARRESDMLVDAALKLATDGEPIVAQAARDWLADALGDELRIDPVAAVFSLPEFRREKLQIMRWWMRDRPSAPEKLVPALARALSDADWEIAATAMLVATTLGLKDLAPALTEMALPRGPGEGLTRDEARLVLALRDVGLDRLGHPVGRTQPPGVTDVFDGNPDNLPIELRHFAAALSLPLPVGTPTPTILGLGSTPEGVTDPDGRLLAWVPPSDYRLGVVDPPKWAVHNPPRIHHEETGFFIDVWPRPPAPFAEAQRVAERMGNGLDLTVRLPTRDMWEMAVRGADGRRFPWGLAMHSRSDMSPLGLSGLFEPTGEWVDSIDENRALTANGAEMPVPSLFRQSQKREIHAFRLVFVLLSA